MINEFLLRPPERAKEVHKGGLSKSARDFMPEQMKGLLLQALDNATEDHISNEEKSIIQQSFGEFQGHARQCWLAG
jgi:hypothetical protein